MVIAVDTARQQLQASRSFNELLPWLLPYDPQTVLCKDRSLLAVFEYHPKDQDGVAPETINSQTASLERLLMALQRDDLYLWFTHTRRKDTPPSIPDRDNTPDRIATRYYENYNRRTHYQHRHYLSVLIRPQEGHGKFIETFRAVFDEQRSVIGSLFLTIKESLGLEAMHSGIWRHIERQHTELESVMDTIESSASPLGRFERLTHRELTGFLNHLTSPTQASPAPLSLPSHTLMDSYLGLDTLSVGEQTLTFSDGIEQKEVAVLSIKNEPDAYPEETQPGIFDVLHEVDSEWMFSMALRMTDTEAAKKFMATFRTFYNNTRKGVMAIASEAVTEKESSSVNDVADVRADQTTRAIKSFATGNAVAAYANISVLVYGDTEKPIQDQVKKVMQALTAKGFMLLRENMHALSAWAGTLPGQWALPVRWVFLTGGPIADMIPAHGIYAGHRQNNYLSEQLNRSIPALAVLETREKAAFYFNFHVGDLGHAFIAGPSRSGKSALVNFLITQWLRYPNARVFVFDKDYSNFITCIMNDGAYIDYASDTGMELNPIQTIADDQGWRWFGQWAEQLLSSKNGALSSEESQELSNAIKRMKAIPANFRQLSLLGEHFTGPAAEKLRNRLAVWTGNGLWAKYFSSRNDDLKLSRYTAIAMDEVLAFPEPARAFMSYIFHRIEQALDGTPTFIYIEEAWFAFEDPVFSDRIKQWLKRLAKKNVHVVMSTQSAFDSENSSAFSALLDNVPTLIFLPHERATAYTEFYRVNFQLDPYQVEQLQELTPKQDYYLVQRGTPKILQSRFDSHTLAYLRSDAAAREIFLRWMKSGQEHWRDGYVQEALRLG